MKVLVTGANGFIGRLLCGKLMERGEELCCASRMLPSNGGGTSTSAQSKFKWVAVGDIGPATDWTAVLQGVEAVIHLAGLMHMAKGRNKDPLAEFRRVNVLGTECLARMAVEAGVSRFIYISSIKVNGEAIIDYPLTEESMVSPQNPYAVSKWEAECALQRIAKESGLEVTIIRPPLVYGPGVHGNFLRLVNWIYKGKPVPLQGICNKRSLVALENLVDLLLVCAEHPGAAGETFLVSDGEDLSAPELITRLAKALGRPTRLLPFPGLALRFAARLLGRKGDIERLFNSLIVDSSKARRLLDWSPPLSVDEGLNSIARWYLHEFGDKAG